MLCTW